MELFKLFGTIAVNNSEANKALSETGDKAEKTQSRLSKVASGVGKGMAAVGKVAAVGIAAGVTALGGLTAKAVSAAGELEQNIGGSEAVFGKYADRMQEKAKQAFSKMGLSTSDYLATANKMGSLFKGAGFDAEEAMTLSSDAMQRAADVASIMGISTEQAMESIAGAAKGNFTMMDNLGVAMNDTTLQAYALEKGIKKSTREMTNQEKIGLAMEMFMEKTAYAAGNYTKENETLAGSLGTAKAAFDNFLAGSGSIDDFIKTFSGAANSIMGQITKLFPTLTSGILKIVTDLIPMLPPMLEQLLPVLIEGAVSLINGLVAALPSVVGLLVNSALPALISGIVTLFNSLVTALPSLIQTLVSALPTLVPMLLDAVVSMIVTLASNASAIIQPIVDVLPTLIVSIITALVNNLPALIEGFVTLVTGVVSALPQIVSGLVDAIPTIVALLVEALIKAVPQLIAGAIKVVMSVISAVVQAALKIQQISYKIFLGVWQGIMNIFGVSPEWFGKVFKAAADAIKNAWSSVKDWFAKVWQGVKNVFSNVASWFGAQFRQGVQNVRTAWSAITNFFSRIWTGIKNVFSSVRNWFTEKFNAAKRGVQSAWEGVTGFFSNIFSKIKSTFSKVKDAITKPFKTAVDKVKGIFSKLKLSFPKIKMPHFNVSPKGWKIGDLLKGKIPKLSVDWYAKAMDNGMILDDATIFGMNSSGQLLGAGEAGSETVVGTNSLLNMINGAVQAETGELSARMDRIINLLVMFFPQMLDRVGNDVVLDTGVLVGQLAPKMNVRLSEIQSRNARGG